MSTLSTAKEYSSGLVASASIGMTLSLDSDSLTKSLNDLGENSTLCTTPSRAMSETWDTVVPFAAPRYRTLLSFLSG